MQPSDMTAPVPLYTVSKLVSDIYIRVTSSKELTLEDRQGLHKALLSGQLSEADYSRIDRILYGLQQGYLQLQDRSYFSQGSAPKKNSQKPWKLSNFIISSPLGYVPQPELFAASRDASLVMSQSLNRAMPNGHKSAVAVGADPGGR